MTENEPPEAAPPPEEPSAAAAGESQAARSGEPPATASGEQAPPPPQPPPSAPRLGAISIGPSPFRFTPPIQTTGAEPTSGPITGGSAPVLQVGPAAAPVFVDIGDQAAKAAITRNGIPIPVVQVQLQGVDLVPPTFSPRVVWQSVPPGNRVPQGTSVDLTLASPGILPMSIIPGVHPGLAPLTIGQVYTQFIQNNPGLQAVLARNVTAPDPASADGQAIISALNSGPTPLMPTTGQTASDVAAAFTGLQAAMTFGS